MAPTTTPDRVEPRYSGAEPALVWSLCTAAVKARSIQIVARLGVADQIDRSPVAATELAAAVDADPGALDRVLRMLATQGVFERSEAGYSHTPASRLLRSDHPQSMRPIALMTGLPAWWGSVTELEHSIRTGSPAVETLEPKGLWAYFDARPEEAAVFGRAMTAKAAAQIPAILDAYDFSRFGVIADIGGGRGHLLRAALDAAPGAEGVLFDLPEVIDAFDLDARRISLQPGDFFSDQFPSADAYLLMEVLHDWPDEDCVAILSAIRRAAPPGACVLVIESVIEDLQDPRPPILDVLMLAITGGRERTPDELDELFDRAGFRKRAVTETRVAIRVVEAVAV